MALAFFVIGFQNGEVNENVWGRGKVVVYTYLLIYSRGMLQESQISCHQVDLTPS